jgi:protein PsiE
VSQDQTEARIKASSARALRAVEMVGLAVIAVATLFAVWQEVAKMIGAREVTLADLLLLFIYLEVLTMVGIYLESGALPVRMPMYIAMVALARHLILDMKELSGWEIIATAVAIFVIALAVLIVRYGHLRFPYEPSKKLDGRGRHGETV